MTHPKPFGELSRAEKGELLLSRHEGKLVEILTSRHGWLTAREYDFWDEARHYRIAPEPLIPRLVQDAYVNRLFLKGRRARRLIKYAGHPG